MPSALLRSVPSSNVTVTIENTDGERIAAGRRPGARGAISIAELVASPHDSEQSANSAEADHEQTPSAEDVARAAAEQEQAAECQACSALTTHCRFAGEKFRSFWIDGNATFTIVDVEHDHEIRDAEKCERLPAAWVRTSHRLSSLLGDQGCTWEP